METPRVTRIHVEYEDGSSDEMELLPENDLPLYDLRSRGPVQRRVRQGVFTHYAVAALVFQTAFERRWQGYQALDPKWIELMQRLFPDAGWKR